MSQIPVCIKEGLDWKLYYVDPVINGKPWNQQPGVAEAHPYESSVQPPVVSECQEPSLDNVLIMPHVGPSYSTLLVVATIIGAFGVMAVVTWIVKLHKSTRKL